MKTVKRDGETFEVIEETDTDVCVLLKMDTLDGPLEMECWWDKLYLDEE